MSQLNSGLKGRRTRQQDRLTTHRQRVLEVLWNRSAPVPAGTIAAELASTPGESRSPEELHCRLRHVDLPKLAAADRLEWDRGNDVVRPTGPRRLNGEAFETAIGLDGEAFEPALRDHIRGVRTVDAGSRERRRAVVSLLDRCDGWTDRSTLALDVAEAETGGEPSSQTIAEVEATLHHIHLPKLEAAGVVAYGVEDGRVRTRGSEPPTQSVRSDDQRRF